MPTTPRGSAPRRPSGIRDEGPASGTAPTFSPSLLPTRESDAWCSTTGDRRRNGSRGPVSTALVSGSGPTLVLYLVSLALVLWGVIDMARRSSDVLPPGKKAAWIIG